MQKQFKYIYNGKEVSREEFEKLAGNSFKWFDGDSIVSVPFSSFDSFFNGEYRSDRQVNDHVKEVLSSKVKSEKFKNLEQDILKNQEICNKYFLDSTYKKLQEKNTNSTRHKSQAGETHKENFLVDSTPLGITDIKRAVAIELEKDDVITSSNRGEKETMEGLKYNNLKPSLDIVINRQFPKALQLIALATEYGHKKYIENDSTYLNYKSVKGGSQTYFDASARHSIDRNGLDESGLPHIIHAVWSSLAGLELWAEENNINVKEFTKKFMKNLQD